MKLIIILFVLGYWSGSLAAQQGRGEQSQVATIQLISSAWFVQNKKVHSCWCATKIFQICKAELGHCPAFGHFIVEKLSHVASGNSTIKTLPCFVQLVRASPDFLVSFKSYYVMLCNNQLVQPAPSHIVPTSTIASINSLSTHLQLRLWSTS